MSIGLKMVPYSVEMKPVRVQSKASPKEKPVRVQSQASPKEKEISFYRQARHFWRFLPIRLLFSPRLCPTQRLDTK
jgi:hypothetical protein